MSKRKFIEADVFSAMTATSQPVQPLQGQGFARQSAMAPPQRKSTEAGLPDGLTRATIIVPVALLEKCRDIAYWERLRDQDVYAAALSAFIAQHEKLAGRPVEPRPSHARRAGSR